MITIDMACPICGVKNRMMVIEYRIKEDIQIGCQDCGTKLIIDFQKNALKEEFEKKFIVKK